MWVAAESWVNRLMVVAVLVVLARELGPKDFGLITVAAFASNVLMVLNDLGFADALVFQRERGREAAETSMLVCVVAGVVLGAGLFVAAPLISDFFRAPGSVNLVRAYSLMVACNAAYTTPKAMLTRDLAFRRRFIPEALPALVGGILTIGLAFGGVGVWSIVIGDGTRAVLSLVLAFVVLPERFGMRWHADIAQELWQYARASLTGSVLDFGLQNVDYLIVGHVLGPVALGLYNLAFRVAILPFVAVGYVVAGVAFPAYARLFPDMARVRAAFRSSVRLACGGTFLLAGALITLAPSLQVLGTKWGPAVTTARLLGVYVCGRTAAHMVTPMFQAIGRPAANAGLRLVWLVALAALLATAGRRGIATVGIIQASVAGAMVVLHVAVAKRLVDIDIGEYAFDVARPALAAAGAAAITLLARAAGGDALRDPHSWLALVALGGVFVAAYYTALALLTRSTTAGLRELRVALG